MPTSSLHTRSHEALPRVTMEGGRYGNEYVEGARSEVGYPTSLLHMRRNSSESGSGVGGPVLSHFKPASDQMVSVTNIHSNYKRTKVLGVRSLEL